MEPPGGPRSLDAIPGKSPNRTPMGGMGYTDAYGNELGPVQPEEKAPRKRLRPGAHGYRAAEKVPPIPNLPDNKPLWKF